MDGDGEYLDDGDGEAGKCGPCARGGGLLLLLLGAGLAYMGADLLTGGALTRLVTGGLAAGIGAAGDPGAAAEDNDSDDGIDPFEDRGAGGGETEGVASEPAGSTAG